MKLDLYTKIILTIIAGCLVWICVKDIAFSNPVHAQQVQRVFITGYNSELNSLGFPVRITRSEGSLSVLVTGIARGKTNYEPFELLPWQPLPVMSVSPTPSPTPK
jgi:hypothetical protein